MLQASQNAFLVKFWYVNFRMKMNHAVSLKHHWNREVFCGYVRQNTKSNTGEADEYISSCQTTSEWEVYSTDNKLVWHYSSSKRDIRFLVTKNGQIWGGSEQKKNVWEAIDKFLDFVLKRRPHFWIKFLPCFILPFFLQLTSLCKFIVLICVFLPFEIIILLDNFVK